MRRRETERIQRLEQNGTIDRRRNELRTPGFNGGSATSSSRPRCIDFILTGGEVNAGSAEVLFAGTQVLRGGPGHVSDHVGLCVRLHVLGA